MKFFHFGMQYPYNQRLIELLKEVCPATNCTLQIFDIAENHELARTYQIYGPNLLIVVISIAGTVHSAVTSWRP